MKIHWGRVVIGGFLVELILIVVLIGGFAAAGQPLGDNIPASQSIIIGIGCFVVAFLVTLWLGRRIQNGLVLHGFLIGLVATMIYLGLVAGSGQMSAALRAYGPATFVTLNLARILGAMLGGLACEKRRAGMNAALRAS